jgi:hypothetical protein
VKDQLQQCIYRYERTTLDALTAAFKEGKMSRDGKQLSQDEIGSIRLSKAWSSNYSKYLMKEIWPAEEVTARLDSFCEWLVVYLNGDESFFTTSFKKFKAQINLNKVTAQYIQDPEGIQMYYSVPPGQRSKHQLPTLVSKRPESKLEAFHGEMAHYANTGMRPAALADVLTLHGVTEGNQRREFRLQQVLVVNESQKQKDDRPGHLSDQPRFFNDALLDFLNKQAESMGFDPHFPNCRCLPPNNGEVFLSEYYQLQVLRNQKSQPTKEGKCTCEECLKPFISPAPVATTAISVAQDHHASTVPFISPAPAVATTTTTTTAILVVPDHHDATAPAGPSAAGTANPSPRERSQELSLSVPMALPTKNDATVHCPPATVEQEVRSPPSPSPATVLVPAADQVPRIHSSMPMYQHQYYYNPMAMLPFAMVYPPPVDASRSPFCCGRYQQYVHHKQQFGKTKPGRIPHDSWCHQKKQESRSKRRKVQL